MGAADWERVTANISISLQRESCQSKPSPPLLQSTESNQYLARPKMGT